MRHRYDFSLKDKVKGFDKNAVTSFFFVRHSSNCSSSWYRLCGEFEIFQKSKQKIIETVTSSDSETDHWPHWYYFDCKDWLTAVHMERDDSADWQDCSNWNCRNLRLFQLSWEVSVLNQSKHWKVRSNGLSRNFVNSKTLVGWCRDRPKRALLSTSPIANNLWKNEQKRKQKKRQ